MVLFCNCLVGDLTILGALVFVSIYLYFKHNYKYWKVLEIPYAEPQFPFGNCKESILAKVPLGINLIEFYNDFKSKGLKYGGVFLFNKPFLVPVCPELIKSILTKDFSHFVDRGFYYNEEDDPLSAHLFALPGQKWKTLRAKITPTFTSGKLKKMFQILVNCSKELKNCLNEQVRKTEPVDIKNILIKYTTDVIGSTAFGIECNSFQKSDTEFIKLSEKIFVPEAWDRLKFIFCFSFPRVSKFLRLTVTNSQVDKFFRDLIKETVDYREKNNVIRNDFMHLLIELKNKGYVEDDDNEENTDKTPVSFTLNELAAQAFLFFVGGFETSSTAMTWSLFELAKHPEIQEKLRKEVIKVLKQHNGEITYDAVMNMPYMDCVLNESMRKYPPFMFLQRLVTKDYVLPDTGKVLIQGSSVLIPTFALHLDPDFYPDPQKFDPDRFLEENKSSRSDYTFLPFGEGPRFCIGLRFAMLQMKVGLCQLILNYKFTLDPKTELPVTFDPYSIVVSAKSNIWLLAENIAN